MYNTRKHHIALELCLIDEESQSLVLIIISWSLGKLAPCTGRGLMSTFRPSGAAKIKFCSSAAENTYSSILASASPRQLLLPVKKNRLCMISISKIITSNIQLQKFPTCCSRALWCTRSLIVKYVKGA